MGAKNSDHSIATYWKMFAKTKSDSGTSLKPTFKKVEKVGEEWKETDNFDTLFGTVTGIEHSSYTYQGDEKHQVKVKLQDASGAVDIVQCGFNGCAYSLLNTLAGSDLSKEIEMQMWSKSVGNAVYAQVSIKFMGERGQWKYKPEDLPKSVKVPVGTKFVDDDSAVIAFWRDVIEKDIKPKLLSGVVAHSDIMSEDESQTEDVPSDLPF